MGRPTGNLLDTIESHSRDIRKLKSHVPASTAHDHDASYSPIGHAHSGADITSGTVAFARLPTGTGASQVAIGDHNHDAAYSAAGHHHDSDYVNVGGDTMTSWLTVETVGQALLIGNVADANPYIAFYETTRQGFLQHHSDGSFRWSNESGGPFRLLSGSVLQVPLGGVYFEGDTDTGWEQDGANIIGIYTGGIRRLVIAATNFSAGPVASETTGSAANVHINSVSAQMFRSTSALKYKTDVTDADYLADIELRPTKHWRLDDERWRYGLVADELAAQDKLLGVYNGAGEVESYDDRAIMAVMAAKLRVLEAKVSELQALL